MFKNLRKMTGLFLLTVFLAIALAGCGQEKIGVVDVDKIVTESSLAKEFQAQLNKKGETISKKLSETTKTGEEKDKEQQQIYQQFMQEKQELEQKLDAEIKKAIEKTATTKKIKTVLYKKDVHYGGIDMTADVIKSMAEKK